MKELQNRNLVKIPIPKQIMKRHIQRTIRRLFCFFCLIGIFYICISMIFTLIENPDVLRIKAVKKIYFQSLRADLRFDIPSEHFDKSFQFNMPDINAERKDWHDYAAMSQEREQIGPGELGKPTKNTDESMKELEKQFIKENHFNGFLSNIISVNRSVPSMPMTKCLQKRYLTKLPIVSIVMPCRNELYSVLQRSLHSIVNRTPKELLKEIIIVDDHSFRGYSVSEMMLYAERNFPKLVKFIKLPKRMGLVNVRVAGAKVATGDVIVFLDSHIECTHNWLPPLLEPIAINDRITTSPVIDIIDFKTFEYKFLETDRGGFFWNLEYIATPVRTGENIDESKPYKDAIMMGGLFAISRRFFWELGGYDLGLDTWGGENIEISFKIWMCGGMLLVVPCSHVGHIWIVPHSNKVSPTDDQSQQRNRKRVAEVWMDEYKHYFYLTNPEYYYNLDAGNLAAQHALRKRLKCKPFKWFREFVAPDFAGEHPFDLPPDFANGTIQSISFSTHCLDTLGQTPITSVGFYPCASNHTIPQRNQLWNFNVHQQIKNFDNNICLDMFDSLPNGAVSMLNCHREGGNQFWYYDIQKKWLVHKENGTQCLEAIKVDEGFNIVVNECDETNIRMQWVFGHINEMLKPLKFLQKNISTSSN